MNVELLRKVKKHILEEPKRLQMQEWICRKSDGDDLITGDEMRRRPYPDCGVAACVAGWTVLTSGAKLDEENVQMQAMDLLNLTPIQANRLFMPELWPRKFEKGLADDGKPETARVAAARIEHFIKTKGKE